MNTARNNVRKVYTGKENRCMCGCSGSWTYTSTAEGPGYEPQRNDATVSRIYNAVMADPNHEVINELDVKCIISHRPNGRQWIVYFG